MLSLFPRHYLKRYKAYNGRSKPKYGKFPRNGKFENTYFRFMEFYSMDFNFEGSSRISASC